MNWDQIASNWKQFKEKYRHDKNLAAKELDEFSQALKPTLP